MKTTSIVCLVLAALLVVFNHVANYWLGYSESALAFAATDPILGLMMESVLFLILMILALQTILLKRHRLWLWASLIGFWPLVILAFILTQTLLGLPGLLTVHGLRDRVMHDYTLDDLRHFARDVNQGISFQSNSVFGKWINHGDTSELTESEKKVYTHLQQKYPFRHWMVDDRGFGGPSIASPDEGIIVFEWGGALPGHWGCSIAANGSINDPSSDPDATILRVSDDIFSFMAIKKKWRAS